MIKRTLLLTTTLIALFAFTGSASAYSVKGGRLYVKVLPSTTSSLANWYGVTYTTSISNGPSIGPFKFTGGFVKSNGTGTATSPSNQTMTITFGNDNNAGSTTTLTITGLRTVIGRDSSYVTGNVTGTIVPAIPGTTVAPGVYTILSLSKGTAKRKRRGSYKNVYNGKASLDAEITNLINSLITPQPGGLPLPNYFELGKASAAFK